MRNSNKKKLLPNELKRPKEVLILLKKKRKRLLQERKVYHNYWANENQLRRLVNVLHVLHKKKQALVIIQTTKTKKRPLNLQLLYQENDNHRGCVANLNHPMQQVWLKKLRN